MKNQKSIKLTLLALCLCALATVSFGQTKTNTKTALTKVETSADVKKELAERRKQIAEILKREAAQGMRRIISEGYSDVQTLKNDRGTYSVAVADKMPTRKEISSKKEGIVVGVIYVKTDSAELPTGYYIVKIWEFVDRAKNTTYGITLVPDGGGIQALSIGAKTNGAAGNSTGLGAKFIRPEKTDEEVLDNGTLPQAIIESVAAYIGSTKSNVKNA